MGRSSRTHIVRRGRSGALVAACMMGLPSAAGAAGIGPGPNATTGADTADRLVIDYAFSKVLEPGNYSVDSFVYWSTGEGEVVPFLATGTGVAEQYELLWIGRAATSPAGRSVIEIQPGHIQFSAPTTVYGGFYTAGGRVGFSVRPRTTDYAEPVVVPKGGVPIGGFSAQKFDRTYSFATLVNPTSHRTIGPGLLSNTGADAPGEDRLCVDRAHPVSLALGQYDVTEFSFNGTSRGRVTPFLVRRLADGSYETVWVGEYVQGLIGGGFPTDPAGGFTLFKAETLYAGISTTFGATVAYTEGAGRPPGFGLTDLDTSFVEPTAAGQALGGFSSPGLAREYAFEISVAAVPEPTSIGLLGLGTMSLLVRRRVFTRSR